MFADIEVSNHDKTKVKREQLNLQKGNLYLVKGLRRVPDAGNCIIHIRKLQEEVFVYRIISTRKGMQGTISSNHTEGYLDSDVEIVTDLECNSKEMNLDTYSDIKTYVADLFPECFI